MRFFKCKDGRLRTTIIIKRNLSRDDIVNCLLSHIGSEEIDLKLEEIKTVTDLLKVCKQECLSSGYTTDYARDGVWPDLVEEAEQKCNALVNKLLPITIQI